MASESPSFTTSQEHLQLLNALRESEILRELSELLASSLDITHILQILVKRTTEVCDVERCTVWLLDEERSLFIPSAYFIFAPRLKKKDIRAASRDWRRCSLPLDDPTIQSLLNEHKMLVINDLRQSPGEQLNIIAKLFFVRSVFLVALLREGQPVGIMSLDNPGLYTTFTTTQQQLARSIGQQAAIAIQNARLYQQAQEERERAQRLISRAESIHTVAMAVNSGEALSSVLEIACEQLMRGLQAQGAAIALFDTETLTVAATTTLSTASSLSPTRSLTPKLIELPCSQDIALKGTAAFVHYDQLEPLEQRWFRRMGVHNTLVVPLMAGPYHRYSSETHCVGLAFIGFPRTTRQIPQGHFAFARDIITQCALAIEKARIIDEAQQAAALATERANTLDAVFNAMSEGITVLSLSGEVMVSNSTASHFLGVPLQTRDSLQTFLARYPTYSLQGNPIPPDLFPVARALRGEHIRGERFVTWRADNTERTVEVNVAPLFDSEGSQIGLVSAFRDVTEQVRVESRVRRALETMLHAAEVISGITDINDILHRVLFMTIDALYCERGIVLHYDQGEQTFTPLLSLGFTSEEEALWLADQQCWLSPSEGQYTGFLQQLLEGHAAIVSEEQCPDNPLLFSQKMILAVPLLHNNRLLGIMMLDRTAPSTGSLPSLSGHLSNDTSTNKRPFNIWDIAVAEGIGKFAGLATEQARWQQEAEIARINEETMSRSNALKDEFLAITAHEFRTPLTVVLAHSQMVARALKRSTSIEPSIREKLNESASTIEMQAHQLTNIVNTFLEVTRLNRGQIVLSQETLNMVDIARQAVLNHRATSSHHDIHLLIEEHERPYELRGDKARLQQVFANLIHNAIKYSPLGGPIIVSLAQRLDTDSRPVIEVQITDKGIGIPSDAQPYLFDRFYRATNVEVSKTRGVGLGLYVVAEFLRLHNGSIHVESSGIQGEGSRFIFTLPMTEAPITQDG